MKKLNKDKILQNLPANKVNLEIYNEIDSTNDEAKRIVIQKDFHVIIAERQTKGRGRLGKKWSSPNSGNIYMTICTENDHSNSPLSLITGLVCKRAINKISNKSLVTLKWPNDILVKNKKIGGILVEKEIQKEITRTIVGIGININIKKQESWWGDLSNYNLETKRNELINQILLEFFAISKNINPNWLNEWRDSCIHMNKQIKIEVGNSFKKEAFFKDIDENGNAIIETDKGKKVMSSGEAYVLRQQHTGGGNVTHSVSVYFNSNAEVLDFLANYQNTSQFAKFVEEAGTTFKPVRTYMEQALLQYNPD